MFDSEQLKAILDRQDQQIQQQQRQIQQQNEMMQQMMANARPAATTSTTATIAPPKQLDVESSDTNQKWENFRSDFEAYCSVSGIDKYPAEREQEKLQMLMLFIGDPAKEKFKHFGLSEEDRAKPIKEILDIIEKKVKKDQPILLERLKFFAIKQEEDEFYEDFAKRVEKAAKLCDFVNITEEKIIRDRVIFGSHDQSLMKKFFEKKESELTLQMVKTLGEASEATTKFMNQVNKKEHSVQKMKQSRIDLCNFCGEKHVKGSKNCSAYGKTCTFCSGKNHSEKVCYKKKANKEKPSTENKKKVKKVDHEDEESAASVDKIIDRSSEGRGVQAEINMKFGKQWTQVNCDLDTGAEVCIIGYDFLCEMMRSQSPKLDESKIKISTVSKEPIRVLGSVKIESKLKKKSYHVRFQVVDLNHGPLLSANACKVMGLLKFCNQVTLTRRFKREDKVVEIPEKLKKKAEEIIDKYSDVFSEEIGKLPGKAKIEIDPNVTPTHEKPRRFPTAKRDQLKKELDDLEKKKIIIKQEEPTDFLSNILMVRKGEKFRICLDPILLNKAVKRPNRQFTTIDEILPELTKAKVFTTVDAAKGFWQVIIDEESSKLTTFSTPFGNYRWLRLPFGISSSPEIFQMKLSEAMSGLKSTEALADDILVYGCGENIQEAMNDHNEKLEALMKTMRKNNCKLNRSKLKLCKTNVKFFGHNLTTDGLKADDSKIEAIKNFPKPKDKKALQRFLGMVTYLGRYIDNLSQQTAKLRQRTLTKSLWNWDKEEQNEFDRLKKIITDLTNLQYFDVNKEIVMECDASSEGLGVVLYQEERPIAYASRTLTNAERNGYAMIEKEMAAIVFGCARFHQMLIGNQTTVRTDHKPLIDITSKPLISAPKRLQMMMLSLQKYDLKFKFVKGKDNVVADALSRGLPISG